jgi:hypothetical protein
MGYRNKTFVSFDGDNDIHYYYLMRAWKDNDNTSFNFYDAHDINTARDTSLEPTIKARLRERMANAKIFALLVGQNTRYLQKFVKWEIEQAISRKLPIVVINLNGTQGMDTNRCPPVLANQLAVHVSYKQRIIQHALDNWPDSHISLKNQFKSEPYYYNAEVYRSLGL